MTAATSKAEPLLRWAGGKRLLVPELAPLVMENLAPTGRYFEPFLGGAALALHLGDQHGLGPRMILGDKIPELVEFYHVVRDEPAFLAWALSGIAVGGVDEDAYYAVRDLRPDTALLRAARMLYLNRLCYNGMYRVNKAGDFNVPYQAEQYRESVVKRQSRDAITSLFPHKGKIEAAARALRGSSILAGSYEVTASGVLAGDVVYCDPPYDGTYNSYTAVGFTEEDQKGLSRWAFQAWSRGATILVSNSDTPLIRELYAWAPGIRTTTEKRSINRDVAGRGRAACVLVAAGHK